MLSNDTGFHRKVVSSKGMSREDVDLWLILTDPLEARRYIEKFDWNCPPEWRPNKVILDSGREVLFEKMTDTDAVAAAMAILRDVEVPMVLREFRLQFWVQ